MSREIGGLTNDCFFLGQRLGAIFTNDHESGCDANPDPNARLALTVRRSNRAKDGQCGVNRPFRVVFVGTRVPEQRHDAVPDVIGDEALELPYRVGATVVVPACDLVEILGIERPGERRRPDDVAE